MNKFEKFEKRLIVIKALLSYQSVVIDRHKFRLFASTPPHIDMNGHLRPYLTCDFFGAFWQKEHRPSFDFLLLSIDRATEDEMSTITQKLNKSKRGKHDQD